MYIGNYIFLVLVLISFAAYYKIFEKLGKPAWKALIPFYNFYVIYRVLEKPWWWAFLMIIPGVNIIMYGVIGYHTACYFGKRKTSDLLIASLMPYLYIAYLGFSPNEKWTGVEDLNKKTGGFVKNWLDPILFAVVAATVIRSFFFEAFTIPTSSLEKSLMVGDFLFVNKFAYGAKVSQTPLAFPFAHHTLPLTKTTKSYLEWLKLPYMRLPGYGQIKNYDLVVFNYPDGDTVALGEQGASYYQMKRDIANNEYMRSDKTKPFSFYESLAHDYLNGPDKPLGEITGRPIDKREFYVKRCVAIAGDKLEVRQGEIYINDVKKEMPENAQHHYFVKCSNFLINQNWLDKQDIYIDEAGQIVAENNFLSVYYFNNRKQEQFEFDTDNYYAKMLSTGDTTLYLLNLTVEKAEKIKSIPGVISVTKKIGKAGVFDPRIYPHNANYIWNYDNFGPFVIPQKGATVKIDTSTICLYDRIIDVYDDNDLEIKGGKVYINGIESKEYTFKQDYYFMMGDNRHNSADSRCWGVVPFDHIVGKPVLVFFSMKDKEKNPVSGKDVLGSITKNSVDGKFRWERFICFVDNDGLSKSYLVHFLVLIALLWGANKLYVRRKLIKEAK